MSDGHPGPGPGPEEPLGDVPPPPPATQPAPDPLPSHGAAAEWAATRAIGFAWEAIKAKPEAILVLFLSMLVGNALSTIGSLVDIAILGFEKGSQDVTVPGLILQFLSIPVSFWMAIGQTRYSIRLARGEPAGLGDVFDLGHWRLVPAYFGAAILIGLAVLVGFVCLIVPGVILAVGWTFWSQFLVDRGGVMRSMRGSWEMTRGRRIEVFAFLLLLLLLNLAGLLACCVGVIVTASMTAIASAWSYVRLGDGREFRAPHDGVTVT